MLRTNLSLVMAVALHIAGIFLLSRPAAQGGSAADLQEVSFMDVTYRPEVAKILPKSAIPGGGGGSGPADFGSGAPAYGAGGNADEGGPIDMSAALARDNSQAQIDMNRYELDRGDEGMGVIRLGGSSTGKSTEEILAQPKVQLARGLARGGTGGGGYGLHGMPGVAQPQAQLTIEHRELSKPAARALPAPTGQDLPKVEAPVSRGTNFMVAGPISQREITRKLVPHYPKWALERRVSGTVVVRIWVQPNGQVKGAPTVESSSGYPDLDQVVVDALRGWEFAPLGSGVKSEDQWGVITFKFMLA
jgi:TonB family protein